MDLCRRWLLYLRFLFPFFDCQAAKTKCSARKAKAIAAHLLDGTVPRKINLRLLLAAGSGESGEISASWCEQNANITQLIKLELESSLRDLNASETWQHWISFSFLNVICEMPFLNN